MEVKQSTLAGLEERMSQPETTPVETTTVVTTEQQPVINDTPAATTTDTLPPAAETITETQPEENSSDFNISFGDTTPKETPAPAQQPQFNLDEEIKKIDKKELLKKAGVSDFAIELDEYIAKGGKPSDYVTTKAIDYNQVSDEELIKEDLSKRYPNLTRDEIGKMYNRRYGISEDMLDDEKEDRLIQLKAEGHLKRQEKIQQQQSFKIPETHILHTDAAYEEWKKAKDSQPQLLEEVRNFYENHADTKSLYESKRVAVNLGEGTPVFNFKVDNPELLTRMFTDDGTIFNKVTSTPTGEPDVRKRQLLGLAAFDMDKFVKDIYNYGLQQGKRSLVEEGQNAQKPQAKVLPANFSQTPNYGVGKFSDKARN